MEKKYILIGLFLLTLIGFQSCTKDFIELDPKTGQLEANYYNNEEEAFLALTAAYDALTVQNWGNLYMASEIFSDDAFGGGGNYGDQEQLKEIDFSLIKLTNGVASDLWNKCYSGIYRVNLYLEKQEKVQWETEGLKERFEAEAHFLRAYFYWDLARHFGWVPIITEVLPNVEDYKNLSQNTPDEVYTQVATDLLFAINSGALPLTVQANEVGRVTKYAAESLLARIYLYHEGFAKVVLSGVGELTDGTTVITKQFVIDALDDVILHGPYLLLIDYADVHDWNNQNNAESIFEWQYSEKAKVGWGNEASGWTIDGNFSTVMLGPNNAIGDPNYRSVGWGLGPLTWSLANEFEAGDPRLNVTVYDAEALLTSYDKRFQNTGYFNRKYMPYTPFEATDGAQELNWAKNYIDIRLADVLLMAAELNLGINDSKALDYFNRVRERALGDGAGLISTPTLAQIQHERRVELACEGHRKWDMLRWGLTYTETAINNSFNIPGGSINAEDFNLFNGFDRATWGMLPIPITEIRNVNPDVLEQFVPAYSNL